MKDAGFKLQKAFVDADKDMFKVDMTKVVKADVKMTVDVLINAKKLGAIPSQAKFMEVEVYGENENKVNDVRIYGRGRKDKKANEKKPVVNENESINAETKKLKEIGKKACRNDNMFPELV